MNIHSKLEQRQVLFCPPRKHFQNGNGQKRLDACTGAHFEGAPSGFCRKSTYPNGL